MPVAESSRLSFEGQEALFKNGIQAERPGFKCMEARFGRPKS